jgi:PRC-barrel domain
VAVVACQDAEPGWNPNERFALDGAKRPERKMRDYYRVAAAMTLIALFATTYTAVQDNPAAQPQTEQPPEDAGKTAPAGPPREPTVTVLDHREVQGILGKEVRGAADENMGRIADVIVDRSGQARAAVIDFGGFLGVGSRKIAVGGTRCASCPMRRRASTLPWS